MSQTSRKISKKPEMFQKYWDRLDQMVWLVDWKKYKLPHCHIYFIGPGKGRPIKIGISNNPYKRLISMQTSHWEQLHILGSFWAETIPKARKVEQSAHKTARANGVHLSGEWFDIPCDKAMELVEFEALSVGVELHKDFPNERIRSDAYDLAHDHFWRHDAYNKEDSAERWESDRVHKENKRLARLAEYGIGSGKIGDLRLYDRASNNDPAKRG